MSEPSKVLPSEWVGRLFSRFQAIYGNRVQTMWANADPQELRSAWADELGRYSGEDIARALEAMRFAYKEFPPTLYQFADLCRDAQKARQQVVTKVNYVRYGQPAPEVLAAIHELSKDPINRKRDPLDWARRILARENSGERVPVYALQCAREAIGL